MKDLDALRPTSGQKPGTHGRFDTLLTAFGLGICFWLWVAYLLFGCGGRLQP